MIGIMINDISYASLILNFNKETICCISMYITLFIDFTCSIYLYSWKGCRECYEEVVIKGH